MEPPPAGAGGSHKQRDLPGLLTRDDKILRVARKRFPPPGRRGIDPETFKKDALQSNRILIARKTLEEWLGATTGQSKCCETCGDAECRTVEYGGDTHEAILAELIVRAGITAAAYSFKIAPPSQDKQRVPVLKLKFRNV